MVVKGKEASGGGPEQIIEGECVAYFDGGAA